MQRSVHHEGTKATKVSDSLNSELRVFVSFVVNDCFFISNQPPDTAKSWGRLPSRLPPLAVTTMVSPQVLSDWPSAASADGLQMKTMFSCSVTPSWRGLLAWAVMIGPSSPAPRPCMFRSPRAPAARPDLGAAAAPVFDRQFG